MITGKINSIDLYKGLSERLDKAIDFVKGLDKDIAVGKYEIDGDDVFASIVEGETTSMDEIKIEAHKKYIDLQYIISGEEIMVYAPIEDCTVTEEYNETKDIFFTKGEGDGIKMSEGKFYIVFPCDGHAPVKGYEKTSFKKAIIKVRF